MKRCVAAWLAAIVVSGHSLAASQPLAAVVPGPNLLALETTATASESTLVTTEPPATPFETVPLPTSVAHPHTAAYACMAVGAGLIGGSFWLADRADAAYDNYLSSKVPNDIRRWFDEATRYDQWSSGTLLGGEALIATGLYLRFLRRPPPPVTVLLAPGACAVSYRF
jgi:hypothetical protein